MMSTNRAYPFSPTDSIFSVAGGFPLSGGGKPALRKASANNARSVWAWLVRLNILMLLAGFIPRYPRSLVRWPSVNVRGGEFVEALKAIVVGLPSRTFCGCLGGSGPSRSSGAVKASNASLSTAETEGETQLLDIALIAPARGKSRALNTWVCMSMTGTGGPPVELGSSAWSENVSRVNPASHFKEFCLVCIRFRPLLPALLTDLAQRQCQGAGKPGLKRVGLSAAGRFGQQTTRPSGPPLPAG